MRRLAVLFGALTLALPALPALAACPAADRIVEAVSVGFSGFAKQIPKVAQPDVRGARVADLVVIRLPNKGGEVPDGFRHAAMLDKEGRQAWIRRRGGFIPVDEWYGPIKLDRVDLAGCVVEPYR